MRVMTAMNDEGLTWDEWASAAGLPRPAMETVLPFPEYERWQRGEDPTETRAAYAPRAEGARPLTTYKVVMHEKDSMGRERSAKTFRTLRGARNYVKTLPPNVWADIVEVTPK